MIFFLNRFSLSAFGLAVAVTEFAGVVDRPALVARRIDAPLLAKTNLHRVGLWSAVFGKARVWHIDDMFAPFCMVVAMLGLVTRRDVVICPHGMLDDWALRTRKYAIKRGFLAILNVLAGLGRLSIHALTPEESTAAQRYLPHARRIVVVPNGVPSDILRDRGAILAKVDRTGPIVVGCLSRISPKKNQMAVIELALQLRQTRPTDFANFRFQIDGQAEDQTYAQQIQDRIVAEGLSDCIHVGAAVPFSDRGAKLADYDILFFPSLSEGMPYVVLEAMALGVVPVVSEGANCPFVENYGGTVFQTIEQAVAALPPSRADLVPKLVFQDAFLKDYGLDRLKKFFGTLTGETDAA